MLLGMAGNVSCWTLTTGSAQPSTTMPMTTGTRVRVLLSTHTFVLPPWSCHRPPLTMAWFFYSLTIFIS